MVVIAHLVGLPYWWEKSPLMTIFLVIFGYWLLINVIFHYYMAVFTPPGYPPEVHFIPNFWSVCQFICSTEFLQKCFFCGVFFDFFDWLIIFRKFSCCVYYTIIKERLYEAVSICKKCLTPKPTRTHHCSICNKCILKMDHHCPWYVIFCRTLY